MLKVHSLKPFPCKCMYFLALGLLVCSLAATAASASTGAGATEKGPDDWEEYWNSKQPPAKVMDALAIAPGMVVGEVGAGRGRYVVKMAERVGLTGKVYANDIDEEALAYLDSRCERDSIPNVETVLGTVTDPRLPAAKLDLVYVINTYHHFEKPVELLRNIIPALKPEGRLVIIEHDPEKMSGGKHSTSQQTVLGHTSRAGFELVGIETFLELDTIYILRVPN